MDKSIPAPPPWERRLASRIDSARRRRFVGRAAEVELFEAALAAPAESFSVLFVYGPGGIGKSSLLDAYADAAVRAGRRTDPPGRVRRIAADPRRTPGRRWPTASTTRWTVSPNGSATAAVGCC